MDGMKVGRSSVRSHMSLLQTRWGEVWMTRAVSTPRHLSPFHRLSHGGLKPIAGDRLDEVVHHSISHEGDGHLGIGGIL